MIDIILAIVFIYLGLFFIGFSIGYDDIKIMYISAIFEFVGIFIFIISANDIGNCNVNVWESIFWELIGIGSGLLTMFVGFVVGFKICEVKENE